MYIYQTMSSNFGFIDIILLAMIAGFIILRLRNILGRKTGHEGKVTSIFDKKKFAEFKPELKSKPILKDTLEEDEKEQFLKGAEIAYENIQDISKNFMALDMIKTFQKTAFVNFPNNPFSSALTKIPEVI